MAGITSVGGIVIPITVLQTGDKNAIKDIEKQLASLTGVIVRVNKSTREQATGIESLNKSLNNLRWTYVNLTFAAATLAGLAYPFVFAAKAAAEYELQLKRIQAVTGALPSQTGEAILGARQGTPFDRVEVSDAFLQFSRAGFDAEQTMSALPSILNLAQAGVIDLGQAADITAQTLHQFSSEGLTAANVADTLAVVADRSKTDIEGLGSALSYVGPLAESSGQSFNEVVALLGELSNAGLDASKAGTSLRQILASLLDPTEKAKTEMDKLGVSFIDSAGNIKPLSQVIIELDRSLKKLSQGEAQSALADIFEVRALAGVEALRTRLDALGGSFDGVISNSERAGAAFVKAHLQQETTVNRLKDAVEAFKDSFLQAGNTINQSITPQTIASLRSIGSFLGMVVSGMSRFAAVVIDNAGPIVAAITAMGIAWGILNAELIAAAIATTIATAGANLIPIAVIAGAGAVGLLVGKLAGLDGGLSDASSGFSAFTTSMDSANAALQVQAEKADSLIKLYKDFEGVSSIIEERLGAEGDNVSRLVGEYGNLQESIKATQKQMEERKLQISSSTSGIVNPEDDGILRSLGEEFAGLQQRVAGVRLELERMSNASGLDLVVTQFRNLVNATDALDANLVALSANFGESFFDSLLGKSDQFANSNKLKPFAEMVHTSFSNALEAASSGIALDNLLGDVTNLGIYDSQIQSTVDSIRDMEGEIVELSTRKEELEKIISSVRGELEAERAELQKLNAEMQEHEKRINELKQARFTGETDVLDIIRQAELFRKKEELAALGVADAQEFINEALAMSSDEYGQLFEQLSQINSEMENNADAFKAWEESIKAAIRAEVEAGQDLGADVTDRVEQWQTALLSISQMSSGGSQQATALDDWINELQMAYDVHFGGMHDEVTNFLDQQRDQELGVFDTSSQLISALQAEIAQRNELRESISRQTDIVNLKMEELAKHTEGLSNVLSEIESRRQNIRDAMENIAKLSSAIINAVQTINNKIRELTRVSQQESNYTPANTPNFSTLDGQQVYVPPPAPTNYTPANLNYTPNVPASFGDFMMRPGERAVSFSPDDTIIGVKDTSGFGTSVEIGTINVQGGSNNAEEIARQIAVQIRRELNTRA